MKIKKKLLLLLTFVILLISLCSISFASSEYETSEPITTDGNIPPRPIRESVPITTNGNIPPKPIRE